VVKYPHLCIFIALDTSKECPPRPSIGKSIFVSAPLRKPPADASKDEPRTDFALGCDWVEVCDEGEEGLLDPPELLPSYASHADIVYTVPSSATSYTALVVPHFLQPQFTLPHTPVVIVLDWTRTPGPLGSSIGSEATACESSRSAAKSIASAVFILSSFLSQSRLQLLTAGQAHLQHYTGPSAEPLPALSEALSSRWAQERSHTTPLAYPSSSRAPRRI
jgi:dynein light intermediate chain 1